MKKLLFVLALLCIVGYAVYAYAFTAGRDNQPVTITSGTVTVVNQALTDAQNTNTGIVVKPRGAGKILTVASSGADYTTIATAITAAGTLSPTATNPITIQIRTGTYTEDVVMASYVSLKGVGTRDGVIIYSAAGIPITLADHVNIENLTVRTAADDGAKCIVDNGSVCNDVNITNVAVESTATGEGSWFGFYFSAASNINLDKIYLRRTAAKGGTGDAGLVYIDQYAAIVRITNSDLDMRGAPEDEGEAMNTFFWISGTANVINGLVLSRNNIFNGDSDVSLAQLEVGRVESIKDVSFLTYDPWLASNASVLIVPANVSDATYTDSTGTTSIAQPVSDNGGSLTVDGSVTVSGTVTATLSDNSVRDTGMLSDDVQVDSCEVNPYTYTEKHYTNVKGIEIYNAAKGIRTVFSKTTGTPTGNQYWLIPSTALGYTKENLNFADLYVNLMENSGSETPLVMINVFK